jgi:macrolide transport system ATP-binding/permease protein
MTYWSRLVGGLRSDKLMAEIDEELDAHLDEARSAGRDPADARRALGSPLHYREESRDVRAVVWLADLVQDLRFGCRMLLRSPGFSAMAIVCLTVGIGANAAVFSWIEGILLRPYPLVAEQERLFAVTGTNRGAPGNTDVSWPDWLELQRSSTLVDAFIAEKITGTTLSVGDRAERASGSMVSANYFDAIGVHPILGRGFEKGEDAGRNAHPVTVISYQMWQDRFHGDPAIIGKTQILSALPHTIVGVAPKGFFGTFVGYAFQFWVPASMQAQFDAGVYKLEDRGSRWIEGYVRLKPGVTIEQAQAELSAVAARLEREYPETNRGRGVLLYPLWRTPFNNAGALMPTLGIALVVVVSVLLIACANVGNLLLVRAFARHQEMTIRLSVGAGRSRLVKQLVTEGLILSVIAAAGGLAVANWLRNALALLTPPRGGVLLRLPGELDWRVLATSAIVCVAATLLFALVPAVLTSQVDLAAALRSQGGGVGGAHRRTWVRSALVLIQVSLSFVLLVGAGLLIQSMQAIRNASPGFSADRVLTTSIDLFTAGYDPPRAKVFQDELIDRLQAIGGVESAAFSRLAPFSYRTNSSAPIAVDGFDAPADQQPTAEYNEIGPAYFATLGIPLISGREFTRADNETGPLAAIVDETMAAQFWRGADPVGRRVQVRGRWMRVVGVARAAKYHNLLETPKPFFYVPLRQNFSATVALHIRTSQTPGAIAPALTREIHVLDGNVAPGELITMREQVDRTTAPQRIAVTILVVFGGLALVLAAVGLYGVMAATVSQNTRELALRIALGADASDVLRLVLSKGLALTAIGVAVGGLAALQLTRLLGYLLYQVSPRDPAAFASACAIVGVAAFVACLVPAWRATRSDPIQALRGY